VEELAEQIGEAVESCLHAGFKLPLHFVAIAANGSVVAARRGRKRSKLLAEHHEPEGWKTPITLLIVDARVKRRTFTIQSLEEVPARMH
jgi:hypothetical protein